MKVYVTSSASTPYGLLGKGEHDSKIFAERANVKETEIIKYFKSLVETNMAVVKKVRKATNKELSD